MIKISAKIKSAETKSPEAPKTHAAPKALPQRPAKLHGTTYKLKPISSSPSLYITINDMVEVVNGKRVRHPYEIFVNSKDMKNFQWIVALTRLISAVFRLQGETSLIVKELQSIFDPNGGYFRGRKYVPSLVADIGSIIEQHLIDIGTISAEKELSSEALQEVKKVFSQMLCEKCMSKSVILQEGCLTCMNCGDSKCG